MQWRNAIGQKQRETPNSNASQANKIKQATEHVFSKNIHESPEIAQEHFSTKRIVPYIIVTVLTCT
jgi:hypothetical protein